MLPQNTGALIPQKAPFIMIDELLDANETTATCSFNVLAANPLVINGKFTEGGLLENMAQTAAAHAGYRAQAQNKLPAPGFIGAVKDLEINALPGIGDILLTEISIENQIFEVTVVKGRIWCKEKLVASCEMKIFIQDNV